MYAGSKSIPACRPLPILGEQIEMDVFDAFQPARMPWAAAPPPLSCARFGGPSFRPRQKRGNLATIGLLATRREPRKEPGVLAPSEGNHVTTKAGQDHACRRCSR